MTRRSKALSSLQPGAFVDVHPDDCRELGVEDAQLVSVESRRGKVTLPVRRSRSVQPGSIFIPFHYREAAANVLTTDKLDPDGKIPEFKFCAVRIAPIEP
jgi:formate dehydrogenase major subunit